jgi:hypothetical protein
MQLSPLQASIGNMEAFADQVHCETRCWGFHRLGQKQSCSLSFFSHSTSFLSLVLLSGFWCLYGTSLLTGVTPFAGL